MKMYRPGLPPVITDEPDESPPQAPAPQKPIEFTSIEEATAHFKALAAARQLQQPEIIPNPTPSPPVTLTGEALAGQSAEVQFTKLGQQLPMGVAGGAGLNQQQVAQASAAASPFMYQGVEVTFDGVAPNPPRPAPALSGAPTDFLFNQTQPAPNPPQIAVDPVETLPSEQADSTAPSPPVEGTPPAPEPVARDVTGMKFPDDVFASELMK